MRLPFDQPHKWYNAQSFGAPTSYGLHEGEDWNLKTGGDSDLGQPIFAIADGVVTSVHSHTTKPTFGNHIHIKHDGAWGTVWCHFAHCQKVLVSEGDVVKEGQPVAFLGKSGTDAAHNHWAIKLQPTGIDGIAKTKEDLKKWTNPSEFVEKWKTQPVNPTQPTMPKTYTEAEWQTERDERNKNWNLYQDQLKETQKYKEQYESLKKESDGFLETLANKLTTIVDRNEVLGALGRLLEVEDQLNSASKKLIQLEKKHELEKDDWKREMEQLRAAVQKQQEENEKLLQRIDTLEAQIVQTKQAEAFVSTIKGLFTKLLTRIKKGK